MAQREPGRQLLNVAVGGQDLAVAVMVVPCLPTGERVELLADWGERDVVGKSHEGRSAAAPGTTRPDGSCSRSG